MIPMSVHSTNVSTVNHNNINNNSNNNNNIVGVSSSQPHQISYSLLTAFYNSLTSSSTLPGEIHENNKVKNVVASRSYNPGRPLCIEDRRRIVRLYEEGNRVSHIARLIGVTHSCVSKIMSRYRRTGSVQPRSYRNIGGTNQDVDSWQTPKKTTDEDDGDEDEQNQEQLKFSIDRILSTKIKSTGRMKKSENRQMISR